jgi:2-amino-4-hydroxy-6-hydroxymethyldihydropteridine diphosphokinase
LGPVALLSRLKSIERRAGRRRSAPRWTPRPLDIDIVDYAGRVAGSVGSRVAGSLVLPHPELHRRPFVVLPLAEIAPRWRHPRTGQSIQMLRWRLARQAAGRLVPQPAAGSASERPAGSARPRHDGRA